MVTVVELFVTEFNTRRDSGWDLPLFPDRPLVRVECRGWRDRERSVTMFDEEPKGRVWYQPNGYVSPKLGPRRRPPSASVEQCAAKTGVDLLGVGD